MGLLISPSLSTSTPALTCLRTVSTTASTTWASKSGFIDLLVGFLGKDQGQQLIGTGQTPGV